MTQERKNFPKTEEEILKFWQENKIFQKTLEKESPKGDFIFYEGPPTANGKPGIHHVLARTFKDVVPRFKTMQGFRVPRKAGWDTHGLPVEIQVEKELGVSGKKEIEEYGIEKFNQKCRESVWTYKDEWEKLTSRMAYWLDMDHPYITYESDYIESVWQVVKKADEQGLLYLGHKVVPHCPRCGTALSSHEVAQGYKEVKEPSVYVKFKLTDEPNTYILSWTTTPWTLPGNVALAVGEDITYVKVKAKSCVHKEPLEGDVCQPGDFEYYYLAKNLYDELSEDFGPNEIIEEVKGRDLVGKEYEPLFPGAIDPGDKKAWYVASADFVTTEDGTGVVHTAVMYGEDDYNLGQKLDLPKVHTVDEAGKFLPSVEKWAGEFVKSQKVTDGIIEDLKARGLLFKKKSYKHDYPFCWRCDTPLLYYAKNSWFIKMSQIKDKLIAENQKVNWIPEHIKNGRFGEWLEGLKDWAISRERYWGTPLPVWVNADKSKFIVIGSYQELAEKAGITIDDNWDPHKPYIDQITLEIDGEEYTRDPAVLDVWLDSGTMPFAQEHYPFENQEKIDTGKAYPADFICEAIDQTRGWFYTLLAIGVLMEKGVPYKNVISLGHILDKHGKKMSKSKGNVVDPWEMMNKYGADALRFLFLTMNQAGETKRFDEKDLSSVLRKNFIILWNVYTFFATYQDEVEVADEYMTSSNILDKWILSKLQILIREVTKNYEKFDLTTGTRLISNFIDDLSTWYLRRSRDRFKSGDFDDQKRVLSTTHFVLLTLSKILAPSSPFIAEDLYRNLNGPLESVHLENWPEVNEQLIDQVVLEEMDVVRSLIEKALALRDQAKIKVRQVLSKLYINKINLPSDYLKIIAEEVNVKEVIPRSEMPPASESLLVKDEPSFKVALDITLTPDLRLEGHLRELVRHINSLRKKQQLTPKDLATLVFWTENEELKETINKFYSELKEATKLLEIKEEENDGQELDINGLPIKISLNK